MRTYPLVAALILTVYGSSMLAAEKNEKLEGAWQCAAATVNGKTLTEETVKQLHLTLTKDRYKTEKSDSVLFDSTYTVDKSPEPHEITMIGTEGDLKGKEAHG